MLVVLILPGDIQAVGLRLEIVDQTRQRVLFVREVEAADRLLLEHTHSVTKRPVEEVFSVGRGGIAMEELRFDEFGANLPAGPQTIGGVTTTFRHEDAGYYRVLHHGRPLGTVPLRVGGPKVDHVLTLPGGDRVRLLDLAPRGTNVELGIRGVPRATSE
ncbi:hypothetical protein F4561_001085 [Lipingzhangella halophila]|uniref:DUF1850 domain-containing protein n=1 Tax=Lipingzhangella halophila TaxID=1783352 RepID=A0A7W7RE21_9ACTN|nr:DUF1850 domain-containing protein [Lipingzhangella halophila]MBB4930265.1 hypothetical protein [Lipingzhangella halophila]